MASLDEALQQLRSLSPDDRRQAVAQLNLADRIVVESSTRPSPRKLRLFSGKTPTPSGEVDYETWRLLVKQVEEDDSVSELDKKRVLLQNLLRPALDAVKNSTTSTEILLILDNLYGSIVDGDELLIKFHTTYQGDKESASEYLQRLYIILMDAAEHGGTELAKVPKLLIKQFIRGVGDEQLVLKLKLEDKVEAPPTFATLLLDVRTQESKALEKKLRLRASARVSVQEASASRDKSEMEQLRVQMTRLETQLSQMAASSCQKVERSVPSNDQSRNVGRKSKSRRVGGSHVFCYHCGKDGHRLETCKEEKNSTLVQEKLASRFAKSGRGHPKD